MKVADTCGCRTAIALAAITLICVFGAHPAQAQGSALTPSDARAISKEAFIYGFPMVANYQTMYKQAIDTTSSDYRAPFNELTSSHSVATPDDKFVVTPNTDTPYSYLWMDLRAEPIVVTVPKIEPNRYYTGQLIDLYTFNFAYLGTRGYGNDGGEFLIAGPAWKGTKPAGITDVIRSETSFSYPLAQASNPPQAKFMDVKDVICDSTIQYDAQFFRSLVGVRRLGTARTCLIESKDKNGAALALHVRQRTIAVAAGN